MRHIERSTWHIDRSEWQNERSISNLIVRYAILNDESAKCNDQCGMLVDGTGKAPIGNGERNQQQSGLVIDFLLREV